MDVIDEINDGEESNKPDEVNCAPVLESVWEEYLNSTCPHQDGSTESIGGARQRLRGVGSKLKWKHLGGSEGSFLRGVGLKAVNHSDDVDQLD